MLETRERLEEVKYFLDPVNVTNDLILLANLYSDDPTHRLFIDYIQQAFFCHNNKGCWLVMNSIGMTVITGICKTVDTI